MAPFLLETTPGLQHTVDPFYSTVVYFTSISSAGLMARSLTWTDIVLLRMALYISSLPSCLTLAITCAWPLTRQAPSAREWICKCMVSALRLHCK